MICIESSMNFCYEPEYVKLNEVCKTWILTPSSFNRPFLVLILVKLVCKDLIITNKFHSKHSSFCSCVSRSNTSAKRARILRLLGLSASNRTRSLEPRAPKCPPYLPFPPNLRYLASYFLSQCWWYLVSRSAGIVHTTIPFPRILSKAGE